MSHFILFGLQVGQIVFIRGYDKRNILNHSNSVSFKSCTFYGIVSDKPDFPQAQFMHDACTHTIIPFIFFESQIEVCFHGIPALVLQLIGLDFIEYSNAAAFLVHIYDHSPALFFNHPHCLVQL